MTLPLTARQRRVFAVTEEEAEKLARYGFEPRVVWVRPSGIDSGAKYTTKEALAQCVGEVR
jgi:hypothetical protein